jgi:uncharacterized protein (DUF2267 family)
MIANKDDFLSHVAGHAGISLDRAERAVHAVLSGLGAYLAAPARQLVAGELPPPLAAALLADVGLAAPIEERVLEPGTTAGQARELVASVCRVLAEELSADAVLALRAGAPPALAALLAEPAPEEPPHAGPAARRQTLAAGRPGSLHPASEARSPGTQTDSVAAENPHAATKLSSTTGSTQERRHETLAEGHLGSGRPLAGTRR